MDTVRETLGVPRKQVLLPFSKKRRGVKVTRDIVYRLVAGTILKLDVVAPATEGTNRPAILQIHGGVQHAFDLFCSPRTAHMLVAVLQFLDATYAAAPASHVEPALAEDGVDYLGVPVG